MKDQSSQATTGCRRDLLGNALKRNKALVYGQEDVKRKSHETTVCNRFGQTDRGTARWLVKMKVGATASYDRHDMLAEERLDLVDWSTPSS